MNEDRLARLEERVRRLEDEMEITRLLASYGPFVDAGAAPAVAQLWTEDGEYDVEGWPMRGRADIHAMVESAAHRSLIDTGCAHFLGPARVVLDGDEATAVCESLLVRRSEDGYRVRRAGANSFRLARTQSGWRIARRVSRALDGSADPRELLLDNVSRTDG